MVVKQVSVNINKPVNISVYWTPWSWNPIAVFIFMSLKFPCWSQKKPLIGKSGALIINKIEQVLANIKKKANWKKLFSHLFTLDCFNIEDPSIFPFGKAVLYPGFRGLFSSNTGWQMEWQNFRYGIYQGVWEILEVEE